MLVLLDDEEGKKTLMIIVYYEIEEQFTYSLFLFMMIDRKNSSLIRAFWKKT
jgi:hypothetical protein